jgi:hypothetical protein
LITNKWYQNDYYIWSALWKNKHERKKGGVDGRSERVAAEEVGLVWIYNTLVKMK